MKKFEISLAVQTKGTCLLVKDSQKTMIVEAKNKTIAILQARKEYKKVINEEYPNTYFFKQKVDGKWFGIDSIYVFENSIKEREL